MFSHLPRSQTVLDVVESLSGTSVKLPELPKGGGKLSPAEALAGLGGKGDVELMFVVQKGDPDKAPDKGPTPKGDGPKAVGPKAEPGPKKALSPHEQILAEFFAAQRALREELQPQFDVAIADIILRGSDTPRGILTRRIDEANRARTAVGTALDAVESPALRGLTTRLTEVFSTIRGQLAANPAPINNPEILADLRRRLAAATGLAEDALPPFPPGGVNLEYINNLTLGLRISAAGREFETYHIRAVSVMGWLGESGSDRITFNDSVPEPLRARINAMDPAAARALRDDAIATARANNTVFLGWGNTRYQHIIDSFPEMNRLQSALTAYGTYHTAAGNVHSSRLAISRVEPATAASWLTRDTPECRAFADLVRTYDTRFDVIFNRANTALRAGGFPELPRPAVRR